MSTIISKSKRFMVVVVWLVVVGVFVVYGCEKDDQGQRITYYKNKTGEGYVFYKFDNDSITPISNLAIEIISYAENPWDMFSTGDFRSPNIAYTNNDGKYSFRFVKRIGERKVYKYNISIYDISKGNFPNLPYIYTPVRIDDILVSIVHTPFDIEINANLLQDSHKIIVDTIFFHSDTVKIRL